MNDHIPSGLGAVDRVDSGADSESVHQASAVPSAVVSVSEAEPVKGFGGWLAALAFADDDIGSSAHRIWHAAMHGDRGNRGWMVKELAQALAEVESSHRESVAIADLTTVLTKLADAAATVERFAWSCICRHESTHRGGAIWEICDECGAKWADDRGGKPEWQDPPELTAVADAIDAARAAIAAATGGKTA